METQGEGTTRPDRRLPREERLRKAPDFARVFQEGQWSAGRALRVVLRRNELAGRRLGVAVSKASGKAVARNLIKRRMREAYRHVKEHLPPGIDLILLPSKYLRRPSFLELKAELPNLVREALRRFDRTGKKKEEAPPA